QQLPDTAQLASPAEFETLVNTRERLSSCDLDLRSDLWQASSDSSAPEFLSDLVTKIEAAIELLSGGENWKLAAVYAGRNGGAHREPWDNLVAFIEQVHLETAKSQEMLFRYAPALNSSATFEDQEKAALEIHAHLRASGSLGFVTLLTH